MTEIQHSVMSSGEINLITALWGGRGGYHYIIYTNFIKSPIPNIFKWENGEKMSQNQTNMVFAENC